MIIAVLCVRKKQDNSVSYQLEADSICFDLSKQWNAVQSLKGMRPLLSILT